MVCHCEKMQSDFDPNSLEIDKFWNSVSNRYIRKDRPKTYGLLLSVVITQSFFDNVPHTKDFYFLFAI